VAQVCDERCPLDKKQHLCTQTENGVSVRTYQTALHFAKALAFFRGHTEVELEDVRQIVPWVLHDKLQPNARSAFFEVKGKRTLLGDRVAWIQNMLDTALEQFAAHEPTRKKVRELREELDQGLNGVEQKVVTARLNKIAALMNTLMTKSELSGPVYEDLIHLKSMYSRYQNYAQWLKQDARG
jgi:hypothetical protein